MLAWPPELRPFSWLWRPARRTSFTSFPNSPQRLPNTALGYKKTRMKRSLLVLVVLGLALAMFASACGGGSGDVPDGAVAVVDGTEVSEAELEELTERAEEVVCGREAGVPEGGDSRVSESSRRKTWHPSSSARSSSSRPRSCGIKVTEAEVDKDVQEFLKGRYQGKRDCIREGARGAGVHGRVVPRHDPLLRSSPRSSMKSSPRTSRSRRRRSSRTTSRTRPSTDRPSPARSGTS